MSFLLSPELDTFRDSLRSLLSDSISLPIKTNESKIRTLKEDKAWKSLVEQGVFLAPAPESVGGLGLGASSAAVICEEAGRALVSSPILETFLFGVFPALYSKTPEFAEQYYSGKRSASANINLNSSEASNAYFPNLYKESFLALPSDGEGQISYIPVSAILGSVDLVTNRATSFDLTRPITVVPQGAMPQQRGADLLLVTDPEKLRATQLLLVSAEMLGAARKLLELTIDYVKTRKQFGVAIGTFQTIQHRLADMAASVESVSAMSRFVGWSIDNDPKQFYRSAISLKSHASSVLLKVAEDSLQLHGGIGFTYEYELHFYLRRIASLGSWFASSVDLWRELGQQEVRNRAPDQP